jgi:glycosyltransferase involved in cell wall biosynthesis
LYLALAKWWITRYATVGLAASRKTALALFGSGWETKPRWRVVYCGIDLTLFKALIDSTAVRAELGVPKDAFVIGHVGRFAEPKNHMFLVEIAAEVAKREPRMHLLLIGDGPLRPSIEQKIAHLGIGNQTIFTGFRSDTSRLMLGAINLFLFPSLYEGLPLVLLEAQAAGLPCIVSDVITEEVEVVKPLMLRLSLEQPASAWANAILAARDEKLTIKQSDALDMVARTAFDIQTGVKELSNFYTSAVKTTKMINEFGDK